MNYSKQNVESQVRKLKKTNKKKRHKNVGMMFFKLFLLIVVGVCLTAGGAVFLYAKDVIDELPDISTVNISPQGYLSTVYDRDGRKIETLASSGANRSYVKLNEIPLDLQHAFVAIEDERFYEHNGIDLKGIVRAGINGLTNGFHFNQGASTITQQLLKNNYFTSWMEEQDGSMDKVNRKIQEQYFAVQLEKITSKDEILENYLNTINLGQNTLGVQAAAQRYFNKSVKELTLSECAVIAGITQNPSKYNPISHPDNNEERRRKVLGNMLDQGYISKAQFNEAIDDDVYSRIQTVNIEQYANSSTTYFVDALTEEVVNDLMTTYGYDESQAYRVLYAGGLSIYATQDSNMQRIVDEEINNPENYNNIEKVSFSYRLTVTKADGTYKNYSDLTMLTYYQASNKDYSINFNSEEDALAAIEAYKAAIMEPGDTISEAGEYLQFSVQPQAACTVINQSNGEVMALTGGRGDKKASKTLNRATDTTRQPGSTFKVVATYVAALDAGGKTLASVEDDAPYTYINGPSIENYDAVYGGWTNFRQAITHSTNVVTCKALADIGTGLGYQYVKDLGITTLTEGDNNQALALGGISRGVTNLELTGAYATIANQGTYNKPHFYTQVLDHNGYVILDNTQGVETRQVLRPQTSFLLTSAMNDVMNTGTGTAANFPGMSTAGKTGTTTKNRDTVMAGYTPYYTAVVWGGYDDNTPQTYTKYSKTIWKGIMSRIHEGLPDPGFTTPSGITTAIVCRKSGKLAVAGLCDCDPRGNMAYTEYFEEGTQPVNYCDIHCQVNVCSATGLPARTGCESTMPRIIIRGAAAGSEDSTLGFPEATLEMGCTAHGGDVMLYAPLTKPLSLFQQISQEPEQLLPINRDHQVYNPAMYLDEDGYPIDQGLVTTDQNAVPYQYDLFTTPDPNAVSDPTLPGTTTIIPAPDGTTTPGTTTIIPGTQTPGTTTIPSTTTPGTTTIIIDPYAAQ